MALTLAMVFTLLPTFTLTAMAADTNTYGAFTVVYDDSDGTVAPTYESSTLTLGNGIYTVSQTEGVDTSTTDRIVVTTGVTANITLAGVNKDVKPRRGYGFSGIISVIKTGLFYEKRRNRVEKGA